MDEGAQLNTLDTCVLQFDNPGDTDFDALTIQAAPMVFPDFPFEAATAPPLEALRHEYSASDRDRQLRAAAADFVGSLFGAEWADAAIASSKGSLSDATNMALGAIDTLMNDRTERLESVARIERLDDDLAFAQQLLGESRQRARGSLVQLALLGQ